VASGAAKSLAWRHGATARRLTVLTCHRRVCLDGASLQRRNAPLRAFAWYHMGTAGACWRGGIKRRHDNILVFSFFADGMWLMRVEHVATGKCLSMSSSCGTRRIALLQTLLPRLPARGGD